MSSPPVSTDPNWPPPSLPYLELEGALVLRVDEQVYSRKVLLRACYWFTDRCFIFIARPTSNSFDVHVRARPNTAEGNAVPLSDLVGEFANSLLDHQLREDIDRETGRIREVLVAKALAEGGILDDAPPGEVLDPVDLAAHAVTTPTSSGLIQLRVRR